MLQRNLFLFVIIAVAQIQSVGFAQTTINYQDDGNFQTASHSEGGVTVTGSSTLDFSSGFFGGIGVVGDDDFLVDDLEALLFLAEGGAQFTEFRIGTSFLNDFNDDGSIDDFRVEGFDAFGTSLGVFDAFGNGDFDSFEYVSLLGASEVKRFEFASAGDAFNAARITVKLTSIPEPNAMLVFCLGGLGCALHRRRRRSLGRAA